MTWMRIDRRVRDELSLLAERDYGGVPLGEAVRRLLRRHRMNEVMRQYEQLLSDPEGWNAYQAEAREVDRIAGEELPCACEEYPEYNP